MVSRVPTNAPSGAKLPAPEYDAAGASVAEEEEDPVLRSCSVPNL